MSNNPPGSTDGHGPVVDHLGLPHAPAPTQGVRTGQGVPDDVHESFPQLGSSMPPSPPPPATTSQPSSSPGLGSSTRQRTPTSRGAGHGAGHGAGTPARTPAEQVADGRLRRRRALRWVGVGAAAWLVVGPLGGAIGEDVRMRSTFENVTSLTMADFGSDNIRVVPGEAGSTDVTVEVTGWTSILGGTPREIAGTQRGANGELALRSSCEGVRMCSLTYTVTVPPGIPVTAEASSGDISMRAITGAVSAVTSSGDIRLDELSGPTTVRVSSGDASVTAFRGPSLEAQANSGDLEIEASTAPDSITAQADSGDIDIAVPLNLKYAVSEQSGSGDGAVGVEQDPASAHRISVSVDSGDYSIKNP